VDIDAQAACDSGGVRLISDLVNDNVKRLALANGPNIYQMLLVLLYYQFVEVFRILRSILLISSAFGLHFR